MAVCCERNYTTTSELILYIILCIGYFQLKATQVTAVELSDTVRGLMEVLLTSLQFQSRDMWNHLNVRAVINTVDSCCSEVGVIVMLWLKATLIKYLIHPTLSECSRH